MFRSLIIAAVLAASFVFAMPAQAQSSGGGSPVHDCTNGCYVVTCRGNNCSLWRCDSTGCHRMTDFTKPSEQQKSALASPAPRRTEIVTANPQGSGVAFDGPVGVNTCGESLCRQVILHGNTQIDVATSENPRSTLRRALEGESIRR